jgi:hypothetical protein
MTLWTTLLFFLGVAWAAEPVSLNGATAEQLSAIDGVQNSTAEAVVALRSQRGRLGSVEELRVLPGISDSELGALRRGTLMDLPMGTEAGKREFRTVDDVLATFDHEPSVELVQQWAMQYSKTHPAAVEAWWRSARKAKLLPTVAVGYRYDDDYGEDYNYVTNDQGENVPTLSGVDRDRDHAAVIAARWDLDDLLMSSNHMRVVSESRKTVELRDEIMEEITKLYFERRRHQVEMLLSPSRDLKAQVEDTLKLMEITAQLDAYTGGRFSGALASAPVSD